MTLLVFVAAALYGGWKAKSIFQALVISGAIGLLNFLVALERIEIYRRQVELGNSSIETAFLVTSMVVVTWIFFFVITLIPVVLRKIVRRLRPANKIGKI